ncbi:MAG TPA: DeoR/GlpR transcriptional regulator [Candidatus Enterenecus stercoripullorum]|nr:DeoR/GlpR transcriptional regulator [Candidatus Enterenecus stercoripullorum]
MLAEERLSAILTVVEQQGAASVAQLCQATGASEATIRRDLTQLHQQGRLSKVHGGAVALRGNFSTEEPDLTTKAQLYVEEKDAIGRYAAAQVNDDDFVFLDAGTTVLAMADYLGASQASFVTTSIACAKRLSELGRQVTVVGGQLKLGTEAIIGAEALVFLERYHFTKAFLGANGITVKQGCTTPDPEEAAIKRRAADQAYMTYVLADSSKFGQVAAVAIRPLEKVCVITERLPDETFRDKGIIKELWGDRT